MNGEKVCRKKGEKNGIYSVILVVILGKNVESIVLLVARQRGRKKFGANSWKHSRKSLWDVELGNCGNTPNWKFSIVINGNVGIGRS